jgi:hypothetical protein
MTFRKLTPQEVSENYPLGFARKFSWFKLTQRKFHVALSLRCASKREHLWVTRRKRDEIYQEQSVLLGRSTYSRYPDVGDSGR